MNQELLIAISAGFAGMFGWGLADFFAKKTIDKVGSVTSLVWAHVFGTIALIIIVLLNFFFGKQPISIPNQLSEWLGLLFFGALQAFVYLLAYKGFEKGQLAILNPVFASYSGLVALVSILVFGELITLPLIFALVTVFIGVILISVDLQGFKTKKINLFSAPGLKEVGSAAILACIWTIGWDRFVSGKDWMVYALLMYAFMTLTAFVVSQFQKINLSIKDQSIWKFFILIGVCEIIAYLGISLGFGMTTFTSIVAVLSGAFSLPTILLARIFLREKVLPIQTIGSIVIVAGIVLLSIL